MTTVTICALDPCVKARSMCPRNLLALSWLLAPTIAYSAGGAGTADVPLHPPPSCSGFQLDSQLAGAHLSVEIALPEGYQEDSGEEYGTIYALDGNYFFDDQPGTLDDFLERGEGLTNSVRRLTAAGIVPPTVLVGIGYSEEDRTRLTVADADAFLGFITDELIPAIETRCRVSTSWKDRILFGYSASAHFSTYALLHDARTGRKAFRGVISISGLYESSGPANRLEEETFQKVGATALVGRQLFLAVGSRDPKLDLLNAHRAFSAKLVRRRYTGLRLATLEYPERGHYDIPEFAFKEGLIWMFSN